MTKEQFIANAMAMYRAANRSDHETKLDWTHPTMASTVCQRLDEIFRSMRDDNVLTNEEFTAIYDQL